MKHSKLSGFDGTDSYELPVYDNGKPPKVERTRQEILDDIAKMVARWQVDDMIQQHGGEPFYETFYYGVN